MRKYRKLFHFSDLLKNKIEFYDISRVKDENGRKGTRYMLCDKLTDTQIDLLMNYDNVIVSTAVYRYAPELKRHTLILLD